MTALFQRSEIPNMSAVQHVCGELKVRVWGTKWVNPGCAAFPSGNLAFYQAVWGDFWLHGELTVSLSQADHKSGGNRGS